MYGTYFGVEDCFSKMVNFVVFFEKQFYFLEVVASVAVLSFVDVASVDDGVDDGLDAVAVAVGCDSLPSERV